MINELLIEVEKQVNVTKENQKEIRDFWGWYPKKVEKVLKTIINGKMHKETYWDDFRKITRNVSSNRSIREWQIVAEGMAKYIYDIK